jgi:hypothetical protein
MAGNSLSSDHRKLLARAVLNARRESEAGAREALRALAVDHHEPFGHMDADARKLRNALRAHGRQLGDLLDQKRGTQAIDRLTHEVAFEHWHRMLFARFLAENRLLMHPTLGASVTLEECQELAREEGKDSWELAATFAQVSLPQIFRQDDPALRVSLPANARTALERIVSQLPTEIFCASDSLGWVYQFWQADKKDEVNASGKKIGADELPSVTQLFTEDYMVDFLLDNTLGAWWAGKVLAANRALATNATSEDELRHAVSMPGCPWRYLRFVKAEEGQWKPAAGTFDGWPRNTAEITCLDPCMGSGHFVVAMFERMVVLRMKEEALDETEAVRAVIAQNMFGLEIDPRCTQIAAFNLALAAWRRVGHCRLPSMNLACSGLSPNTSESDWVAIAGSDSKLRNGMERLYRLFEDAPALGSLINPRPGEGDLLVAGFDELQPLLETLLAKESHDVAHELAVTARGLAKAAALLARRFTLVATNVPYLGRGKQGDVLKDYCERFHPSAKADLATCFVERCIEFCGQTGTAALVSPQNWLFLVRQQPLRRALLARTAWRMVGRLGTRAFDSIGGEVVSVALLVLDGEAPPEAHLVSGLDVQSIDSPQRKPVHLVSSPTSQIPQRAMAANADAVISFDRTGAVSLLSSYVTSLHGISTTDTPRFTGCFWEVTQYEPTWVFQIGTIKAPKLFDGRSFVLRWEGGRGSLQQLRGKAPIVITGLEAWGRRAVAVSQMGALGASVYDGDAFVDGTAVLLPKDDRFLPAILAFCSSAAYPESVRRIDQAIKVTYPTLAKVPFDLAHWQSVAEKTFPDGLPIPHSSDPTQWLFDGFPAGSDQSLNSAVARLLGYRWPRQAGSSFPGCPSLGFDGLEKHADEDGIVPINPMRGEPAASERLLSLLREAFVSKGQQFDLAFVSKLLTETGGTATDLSDWLLNDFFEQHCKLFHNRPFVWHIWDGRKDGFNVLVNYHRLAAPGGAGRQLLEKLTYDYLKDWIDRQNAGVKNGDAGAEARLAAATKLQKELIKIIEGEAPYDIFVRWKPLSEQAIGWAPDINDGVRMNIRPFMLAEDMGKKGAGLLRTKPNIKWDKDRGKEPERPKADFPWFWSCDPDSNPTHATDFTGGREFSGERWNDLHYTLAVKTAAKARAAKEKK